MKLLLAVLAFSLSAYNTQAADFRTAAINPAGCDVLKNEKICAAVLAYGKIERGDADKLAAFLARVDASLTSSMPIRVGTLFLDSPGGNVVEAMNLGRLIRSRQIGTFVTRDSTCASACVLLLAAGVHRGAAGPVVIHSFYSPEFLGTGNYEQASRQYDAVQKLVDEYLKEMRIPHSLLEEMMKVPHSTSRRLSLDEIVNLALLGVDPVYAQVRKQQ